MKDRNSRRQTLRDVEFIKDLRDALKDGLYDSVDTMLGDWQKELESTKQIAEPNKAFSAARRPKNFRPLFMKRTKTDQERMIDSRYIGEECGESEYGLYFVHCDAVGYSLISSYVFANGKRDAVAKVKAAAIICQQSKNESGRSYTDVDLIKYMNRNKGGKLPVWTCEKVDQGIILQAGQCWAGNSGY